MTEVVHTQPRVAKVELDGPKLLVALLYAEDDAGEREVRGFTRIEKLLFLVQEESLRRHFYDYIAYDYGPWSDQIHDYLEALELRGVVKIKSEATRLPIEVADMTECFRNEDLDGIGQEVTMMEVYSLTKQGERAGEYIWKNISNQERGAILAIKKDFNRKSLRDLIRYVYERHPDYAVASKIRDRMLNLSSSFGSRPSLGTLERDEQ